MQKLIKNNQRGQTAQKPNPIKNVKNCEKLLTTAQKCFLQIITKCFAAKLQLNFVSKRFKLL